MDFSLTSEQESIVQTATTFARDVLTPSYQEREKQGRVDEKLLRQMGELGLIGAELPERLGGLGLDYVTSGLIMEAIGAGDFNVGYVQLLASLCGHVIAENMPEEVAKEWLPGICSGEHLVALALTEPGRMQRRSSFPRAARAMNTSSMGRRPRFHGLTRPTSRWSSREPAPSNHELTV